ncbi:hypothetical protein FRC08_007056 [Ceratobasidium sp. 394]|nr:hypothetical protein FRC08_007056 [Ceratobasidium sp. 394]KAG9083570.1 hypothetical protein FS749_005925 [Ceratobasidium sp. UAMH 11750]
MHQWITVVRLNSYQAWGVCSTPILQVYPEHPELKYPGNLEGAPQLKRAYVFERCASTGDSLPQVLHPLLHLPLQLVSRWDTSQDLCIKHASITVIHHKPTFLTPNLESTNPEDTGHTSDLAALAVLLPGDIHYTRVVQQVLFNHITIDSYARYARFIRTLQSADTPDRSANLASMVHGITAILNTRPFRGEERFIAKHILNLYDQCPKLKQVTVLGARDDRFSEHLPLEAGDLELIGTLESIRCLTLTCPPGYLGPCMLLNLPSLQELHVLGGPAVFQLIHPTPRSGRQLRHITWGAETPPTLHLIRWLFAHSTEPTGGTITLLTPPASAAELEQIRQYAFSREMQFYSSGVLGPGET